MKISPLRACEILKRSEEICPAAQVNAAVSRVAHQICAALADTNPLVIVVMRGAVVFAGQLLPQLTFPLHVDSIDATRYSDGTCGGEIIFRAMPVSEVAGRTVLLVDDILDEGITLKAIRDKLLLMNAHKVVIAVFADKQTGKAKPLIANFVGVTLPNRYVFGFGMDIHGYWRNLPSIYAMKDPE
ncbi:MAG: hypoxanthine-guanine phosphoribosyltransferase [Burkholderiales bacterium]